MACFDFGTLKLVCLVFGTLLLSSFIGGVNGSGKSKSKSSSSNCDYSDSYDLNVEGSRRISQKNEVGRVNIGDSFLLEFSLIVNETPSSEWTSILHIGESDSERSPGIWFAPSSTSLHICLSDIDNWNTYNNIDENLELGVEYKIKLTISSDGQVICYLNDEIQFSYNDTIHLTRFKSPVFIGDPWYNPVNGTVKDLIIQSYDDKCASASSYKEEFEQFENRLSSNDHDHDHGFESLKNKNAIINNTSRSFEWVFEPWQMIIISLFAFAGVFSCLTWIKMMVCSSTQLQRTDYKSSAYGTI